MEAYVRVILKLFVKELFFYLFIYKLDQFSQLKDVSHNKNLDTVLAKEIYMVKTLLMCLRFE